MVDTQGRPLTGGPSITGARKLAIVGLAAAFNLGLAACGQTGSIAKSIKTTATDPAATCAEPATYTGVRATLLSLVAAPADESPSGQTYRDQLLNGAVITFSQPTLSAYDKDTKKVSCSAQISLTWPPQLFQQLKSRATPSWAEARYFASLPETDSASIDYDIRPQADGAKLLYSVEGTYSESFPTKVADMVRALMSEDDEAADRARQSSERSPQPVALAQDETSGPGAHMVGYVPAQLANTQPARTRRPDKMTAVTNSSPP